MRQITPSKAKALLLAFQRNIKQTQGIEYTEVFCLALINCYLDAEDEVLDNGDIND